MLKNALPHESQEDMAREINFSRDILSLPKKSPKTLHKKSSFLSTGSSLLHHIFKNLLAKYSGSSAVTFLPLTSTIENDKPSRLFTSLIFIVIIQLP